MELEEKVTLKQNPVKISLDVQLCAYIVRKGSEVQQGNHKPRQLVPSSNFCPMGTAAHVLPSSWTEECRGVISGLSWRMVRTFMLRQFVSK
jgi:hypothetical protein